MSALTAAEKILSISIKMTRVVIPQDKTADVYIVEVSEKNKYLEDATTEIRKVNLDPFGADGGGPLYGYHYRLVCDCDLSNPWNARCSGKFEKAKEMVDILSAKFELESLDSTTNFH